MMRRPFTLLLIASLALADLAAAVWLSVLWNERDASRLSERVGQVAPSQQATPSVTMATMAPALPQRR